MCIELKHGYSLFFEKSIQPILLANLYFTIFTSNIYNRQILSWTDS